YECMMEYFIENCEKYIKENAVKILQTIYKSEKFKELKNIYLEKFCDYGGKLFESNDFESLEKIALLEVIKRDDFDVDEIVIWEKILKWGLARHPEIHIINVKHWTSQDFINLGNTIKEFLYLIRYQDISNEDFSDKIVPYQMLFPKDLWDNVLRYYLVPGRQQTLNLNLLPSRKSKFESLCPKLRTTIINKKIILIFASRIDKKST